MPKNKKRNTPHRGGSGGSGTGAAAATAATAGKGVSPPPTSPLPAGLASLNLGRRGICSSIPLDICVGRALCLTGELQFPACRGGSTSRDLDLACGPNSLAPALGAGRGGANRF